jgi:hypothetical protein
MKMNMPGIAGCILIAVTVFSACTKVVGDGPVKTENRTATNFSELDISIPGEIEFRQDNSYKVEITAQQNILDIIEADVNGNELEVKYENDVWVKTHDRIHVVITAPDLAALRLRGSGTVSTVGNLQTNDLRLSISGSGDINIPNLDANTLRAEVSGSGDIHVGAGSVESETLKISGSGSINLLNVMSKSANTTTTGSGEMRVNVSERLDARITGSGSVRYKGNPVVSAQVTGSGKVKPI